MMIVNETAKLGVRPFGECGFGSRNRVLINDAEALLGLTQQPKTRRRAALDINQDEIGAVRRYRSKQQRRPLVWVRNNKIQRVARGGPDMFKTPEQAAVMQFVQLRHFGGRGVYHEVAAPYPSLDQALTRQPRQGFAHRCGAQTGGRRQVLHDKRVAGSHAARKAGAPGRRDRLREMVPRPHASPRAHNRQEDRPPFFNQLYKKTG